MSRFLRGMLHYPVVIATLAVGILGGALEFAGLGVGARWTISIFALGIAAIQAKGMIDDLRAGSYGIDLLAVTAIGSTVAVGEYWAALVVCLMLSGGEALEDYAANRAKRELTALLDNAPEIAHKMSDTGELVDLNVADILIGDVLVVRPFEFVPVDGTLDSDSGTFDESSLTGESLPVERERGDMLYSGAINGGSAITMIATASAADSQYQRIIELVREAQESKAPFVRLADRVAVPFTIFALVLAGAAWLLSGDPVRMAEVLVVATPCPLIIAAPVAFMAGMSRSARAGIIVKSSGTLEQLAAVKTVAFDKTGTLTYGRPEVAHVAAMEINDQNLLQLAAALEQFSSHPLAAAIVAAVPGPLPEVEAVEEIPAHGVKGIVDGLAVVVGKAGYIASVTGTDPGEPPPGHSAVHIAINSRYAGYIALADELRSDARTTIEALHRVGVTTTMMISGDSEHVANHIAAQIGIDDVRANLLPEDKVRAVEGAPRRPVMMVGDGVNDAPVLAASDVGVAMGARGSSAASESADVVIMLDDLFRAARAVLIGRRTMRIAWQAIGIGLALSVGLMIFAAFGGLPAIIGAWTQEAVDLATILWALLAIRAGKEEVALTSVSSVLAPAPVR